MMFSRYMDFMAPFYGLFFKLKNWLLKMPQISVIILAMPVKRNIYYFRKLVLITRVSKRICYFSLFICYVRETEGQGSIFRIIKIQQTISLAKISLIMQFNLIDLLCCDNHH